MRFLSYAVYNFSCIKVYRRPADGSLLEPKHVAVNKLIKLLFCVTVLIVYLWFVNTNGDVSR